MPKTKLLILTRLVNKVNEKGQARINKALEKESELDSDEMSPDFYDRLGLQPPKELDIEREIDKEGNIRLDEDEIDNIEVDLILRLSEFEMAEEGDFEGSIITTKSGREIDVVESALEVYSQIEDLERNWFEIFCDKIRRQIMILNYRLKGKKIVRLEEILARPENQPPTS